MTLFDDTGSALESGPAGPAIGSESSICRLLVAYDGTGFRGFAKQAEQQTVEAAIGHAVEKVLRREVEFAIAGRTDAGVHAWGQVVSFEAPPGLDPDRLRASINWMLGPEVDGAGRRRGAVPASTPGTPRAGASTATRS